MNCPIHIEICPRFSQIVVGWDIKKIVVSTLWMDVSAINCIDAQKEIHKWTCASVAHEHICRHTNIFTVLVAGVSLCVN